MLSFFFLYSCHVSLYLVHKERVVKGTMSEELFKLFHYNDVIMRAITSQTTSLTIVYSTVYSGANKRKHRSSASLAAHRSSNAENDSIWWRHYAIMPHQNCDFMTILPQAMLDIMQFNYNTVIFSLQIAHNRHSKACSCGRGVGCLL